MFRLFIAAMLLPILSGCISETPNIEAVEYVELTGVISYKEKTLLPADSSVLVAVLDANKRGSILMQREFDVAKLPVPFYLSTPLELVDEDADYVVWAAIKVKGVEGNLLQTQKPFVRVINNDQTNAVVEVKPVK